MGYERRVVGIDRFSLKQNPGYWARSYMNSDRCYHIPTSPGQSMCTCEDNRMFLELLVELQARHIATLERRLQTHEPKVIFDEDLG